MGQAALVAAALAFEHAFSEGPMRPTRQVWGASTRGHLKAFSSAFLKKEYQQEVEETQVDSLMEYMKQIYILYS